MHYVNIRTHPHLTYILLLQQHLKFWLHPSDLRTSKEAELSGWQKENSASPFCVPHRAVSVYQNLQPRVSCCPRGGFRPLGGNKGISTEFKELTKKDNEITPDYVKLFVDGIDTAWGEKEFFEFCRKMAPPHGIIHQVKVTTRHGATFGSGIVFFSNYKDAQNFVKNAHGKLMANSTLHVAYARSEKVDPGIDLSDNSWVQAEKNRFANSITNARMNRLIKSCGVYYCFDVSTFIFPVQSHPPTNINTQQQKHTKNTLGL